MFGTWKAGGWVNWEMPAGHQGGTVGALSKVPDSASWNASTGLASGFCRISPERIVSHRKFSAHSL